MSRCRKKHRIWIRIIAMVVVCLFTVNTISWAMPGSTVPIVSDTLQVQSMFSPILDQVSRELKAQAGYELYTFINSVLHNKTISNHDLGSKVDRGYSKTDGKYRILHMSSSAQTDGEETVIGVEVWQGPNKGKKFKVTIKCANLDELFRDEGKLQIEELEPSSPGASQMGKDAKAEKTDLSKKMAWIKDSKGVTHELKLFPQGEVDVFTLKSNILSMDKVDEAHKKLLISILDSLKDSLELWTFNTLIKDLFGFVHVSEEDTSEAAQREDLDDSPLNDLIDDLLESGVAQKKAIVLYRPFKKNAVALFHEVAEYLIKEGKLVLMAGENQKMIITIDGKEMPPVAISDDTFKYAGEEKWPKGWHKDPHYLLRVLQRELFGDADKELTKEIQKFQESPKKSAPGPSSAKKEAKAIPEQRGTAAPEAGPAEEHRESLGKLYGIMSLPPTPFYGAASIMVSREYVFYAYANEENGSVDIYWSGYGVEEQNYWGTIPFGEDITIGRDESNTIQIESATASHNHCSFKVTKDASGTYLFEIVDLASTNGTHIAWQGPVIVPPEAPHSEDLKRMREISEVTRRSVESDISTKFKTMVQLADGHESVDFRKLAVIYERVKHELETGRAHPSNLPPERQQAFEKFKENVKRTVIPNIEQYANIVFGDNPPVSFNPEEFKKFFRYDDNFALWVDYALFSDYEANGHVFYVRDKTAGYPEVREFFGDDLLARYLIDVYVLMMGVSEESGAALEDLKDHFRKFMQMQIGRLKLFDKKKGEYVQVNQSEPHVITEIKKEDVTIYFNTAMAAWSSSRDKNRYYVVVKYKGDDYVLYRSASHNRWKRFEIALVGNFKSGMRLKDLHIDWFAKPNTEAYNDVDPELSAFLDQHLHIDANGELIDEERVTVVPDANDLRLRQILLKLHVLVDEDGNVLTEQKDRVFESGFEVDRRRYAFIPWSAYRQEQMKRAHGTRYINLRKKEGSKDESDFGIASEGIKGFTRAEHEEFHGEGIFAEVIESIAKEVHAPKRKNGRYDLRKVVERRPDKRIETSHGEIRIDKRALVIIDDRFEKDHAGRNEYAVYARNEAKVQHELTELSLWVHFAVQLEIVDRIHIQRNHLGTMLREWMNDKSASRIELLRRQRLIVEQSVWTHREGLMAEMAAMDAEDLVASTKDSTVYLIDADEDRAISASNNGLRLKGEALETAAVSTFREGPAAERFYEERFAESKHILVIEIPREEFRLRKKSFIPERYIKGYFTRETGDFKPNVGFYKFETEKVSINKILAGLDFKIESGGPKSEWLDDGLGGAIDGVAGEILEILRGDDTLYDKYLKIKGWLYAGMTSNMAIDLEGMSEADFHELFGFVIDEAEKIEWPEGSKCKLKGSWNELHPIIFPDGVCPRQRVDLNGHIYKVGFKGYFSLNWTEENFKDNKSRKEFISEFLSRMPILMKRFAEIAVENGQDGIGAKFPSMAGDFIRHPDSLVVYWRNPASAEPVLKAVREIFGDILKESRGLRADMGFDIRRADDKDESVLKKASHSGLVASAQALKVIENKEKILSEFSGEEGEVLFASKLKTHMHRLSRLDYVNLLYYVQFALSEEIFNKWTRKTLGATDPSTSLGTSDRRPPVRRSLGEGGTTDEDKPESPDIVKEESGAEPTNIGPPKGFWSLFILIITTFIVLLFAPAKPAAAQTEEFITPDFVIGTEIDGTRYTEHVDGSDRYVNSRNESDGTVRTYRYDASWNLVEELVFHPDGTLERIDHVGGGSEMLIPGWKDFMRGANLPWGNYGFDLGLGANGETHEGFSTPAKRAALYQELSRWKGGYVRVFLFCDLRSGITFDGSGTPLDFSKTGPTINHVYDDMDALVEAADMLGIKLIPVLFDYMLADGVSDEGGYPVGEHPDLITDSGKQAALLTLMTDFIRRYANNSAIAAWDVMNEPTICVERGMDIAQMEAFLAALVDMIRAEDPSTGVTVGAKNRLEAANWTALNQTLIQLHYYDYMSFDHPLDDPVSMGKPAFYGEVEPTDIQWKMRQIYDSGADGALFWQDTSFAIPDAQNIHAWNESTEVVPPSTDTSSGGGCSPGVGKPSVGWLLFPWAGLAVALLLRKKAMLASKKPAAEPKPESPDIAKEESAKPGEPGHYVDHAVARDFVAAHLFSDVELRKMLPQNITPEQIRKILIGFIQKRIIPVLLDEAVVQLERLGIAQETVAKLIEALLLPFLRQDSAASSDPFGAFRRKPKPESPDIQRPEQDVSWGKDVPTLEIPFSRKALAYQKKHNRKAVGFKGPMVTLYRGVPAMLLERMKENGFEKVPDWAYRERMERKPLVFEDDFVIHNGRLACSGNFRGSQGNRNLQLAGTMLSMEVPADLLLDERVLIFDNDAAEYLHKLFDEERSNGGDANEVQLALRDRSTKEARELVRMAEEAASRNRAELRRLLAGSPDKVPQFISEKGEIIVPHDLLNLFLGTCRELPVHADHNYFKVIGQIDEALNPIYIPDFWEPILASDPEFFSDKISRKGKQEIWHDNRFSIAKFDETFSHGFVLKDNRTFMGKVPVLTARRHKDKTQYKETELSTIKLEWNMYPTRLQCLQALRTLQESPGNPFSRQIKAIADVVEAEINVQLEAEIEAKKPAAEPTDDRRPTTDEDKPESPDIRVNPSLRSGSFPPHGNDGNEGQGSRDKGDHAPLILSGKMDDVVFAKGDKKILIPGEILSKLHHMTRIARELRIEMGADVGIKDGRAVDIIYEDDPNKIAIVAADLDAEELMNTTAYYTATYMAFGSLIGWALYYLGKQQGRGLSKESARELLTERVQRAKEAFSRYHSRVSFYSKSKDKRIDITEQNVLDILNLPEDEIQKFADDLYNISTVATEWIGAVDFQGSGRKEDFEYIHFHNHPIGYACPPSAIREHGREWGDIFCPGFFSGRVSGLILDTKDGDEVFLLHEPDDSKKQAYLDTYEKFWEEGDVVENRKANILEDLRRLTMKTTPVKPESPDIRRSFPPHGDDGNEGQGSGDKGDEDKPAAEDDGRPDFAAPSSLSQKEGYDGTEGSYDETYPNRLIDILKRQLPKNKKPPVVLELGTGQGQIADWMNAQGVSVLGMDIQREAIEKAKRNARKRDRNLIDVPNLAIAARKLEQSDKKGVAYQYADLAYGIPLPDASVDAVVFHRTLSQILDVKVREKIVQEIFRVLKPGGRLSFLGFRAARPGDAKYEEVHKGIYEFQEKLIERLLEKGMVSEELKYFVENPDTQLRVIYNAVQGRTKFETEYNSPEEMIEDITSGRARIDFFGVYEKLTSLLNRFKVQGFEIDECWEVFLQSKKWKDLTVPLDGFIARKPAGDVATAEPTKVVQKLTFRGRNNDILYVITSEEFREKTGTDFAKGEHTFVDIGVGALPITTCDMAEGLKKVNPGIKVIGTDLPRAVPKAHIIVPFGLLPKDIAHYVRNIINEGADYEEIRLTVDTNGDVIEAIVKYKPWVERGERYYTFAVSPHVVFIDGTQRTDERSRRTELFDRICDFVGKDRMQQLIKGGVDTQGDIRIEFNPTGKMLENAGARFVATKDPAKAGIKEASIITVSNVTIHMGDDEKKAFMKMLTASLRDGGVLVIKNVKRRDGLGYPDDFIDCYQLKGGVLEHIGQAWTRTAGDLYRTFQFGADGVMRNRSHGFVPRPTAAAGAEGTDDRRPTTDEPKAIEKIDGTGEGYHQVMQLIESKLKDSQDPIDFTIDLSLFSKDREDLERNMETWAYLILLCKDLENVRFRFEMPNVKGKAAKSKKLQADIDNAASKSEVLRVLKEKMGEKKIFFDLDVDVNELFRERVNNSAGRKNVIEIPIWSKAWLEWIKENKGTLEADQYPIAMDEFTSVKDGEIALRNFQAALTIGLSKAALVITRRSGDKQGFEDLKEILAPRLDKLYTAIFGEPKGITPFTLDSMVYTDGNYEGSMTKINLALSLALPPIIRLPIDALKDYHDKIHNILIAA